MNREGQAFVAGISVMVCIVVWALVIWGFVL